MSDLMDFLLERIAEDEAAAREPNGDRDDLGDMDGYEKGWHENHLGTAVLVTVGAGRVLAECEAKRRIVADFEHYAQMVDVERTDFAIGRRHAAALAVQRVAAIYANHPDFRPEWRA